MVELSHRKDIPNFTIKIHPPKNGEKATKKLQPLRSLFTPNKRKELIKKLYHKNEAEFDNLINELESVHDWQQALKKVDQHFKKFNINLHDRNAVTFTDILYSRYFPEESQIKIK